MLNIIKTDGNKRAKKKPSIDQNKKLISAYSQFDKLLNELKKKKLPKNIFFRDFTMSQDTVQNICF